MTSYFWKQSEKKEIKLQSGDILVIQGINAADLSFDFTDGRINLSALASKLSFTVDGAIPNLNILDKISIRFEDGSKFYLVTGSNTFGVDPVDSLVITSGNPKSITGNIKNDVIYGTDNNDIIYPAGGADRIYTLDGNDKIDGTSYYDISDKLWKISPTGFFAEAGNGDDTIYGAAGDDTLSGGNGNDKIYGNGGKDKIDAGAGDDLIDVSQRWDPQQKVWLPVNTGASVLGGAGDDTIYGGFGDDTLDGGEGRNYLSGGKGNDTYAIRSRFDKIVDSGGEADKAIVYANWFKPNSAIEQWSWADGVEKLPYWIDALTFSDSYTSLQSDKTTIIKFVFAETAPDNFNSNDKDGFQAFTQAQRDYAYKIFDYISSIINVKFIETKDASAKQVLALANNKQTDSGGYANNFVSNDFSKILINKRADILNPDKNNATAFNSVLIHELGHVLGLKHPFSHADSLGKAGSGPFLADAEENTEWTVMSYTNSKNKTASDKYSPFDIAALQSLFGVASGYEAGNNQYKLSDQRYNFIFDGGGEDVIDGSDLKAGLHINLEPGYWNYVGKKSEKITDAGQIAINFGSTIENLKGSAYADYLIGNSASNRIYGGAGDDTLGSGDGGYDYLDGGEGNDLAIISGKRSDYTILSRASDYLVTAKNGSTEIIVQNIEQLKFNDVYVTFDYKNNAGIIYRLYQAAFDRTPDAAGLGYWLEAFDKGAKLIDVADSFVHSAEFQKLLGSSPTNIKIVDSFYKNVLHRSPDQAGYDFWLDQLNNNKISVADMLASFSESSENQTQVIGQIQNGIDFIPWQV